MSNGPFGHVPTDKSAINPVCISPPVVCGQNTCACGENRSVDARDDDAQHSRSDEEPWNANIMEGGSEDSTAESDNENYDSDYVRGRQKVAQTTGRSGSMLAPHRQIFRTTGDPEQPHCLGNSPRSRSAVPNSRDGGTLLAKLAAGHAASDVVIDAADSVVVQDVSQRHTGKAKICGDDNRSHKAKPRVHRVYEEKMNRSQGRDAKAREGDVSE